jgi:MYXO-CTERM domain-containing protein
MKRTILSLTTAFALMAAGALVAQSPQNTTAPGPTQQQEPGQTNNNLPNPGNPQTNLDRGTATYQEGGTTSGTATESMDRTDTTGTTTGTSGTTGLQNETSQGGMDVDVDAGDNAAGAVDVDVTSTTDADTDASGINETGEGTYSGDTDTLPDTASEVPAYGLIGLLALGAFVALRARRNA